MEERFKKRIKKAIFDKPYMMYFIITSIVFFAGNMLINQNYLVYLSLTTLTPWFAIGFFGLNIIVPLLVALNLNLVIIRYKEVGGVSVKGGGLSSLGVFGGILGGSCPACFAGLFPALMGVIGLTFSRESLPLLGLEIQIFAVVLLLISIKMFIRDPVCKIKLA